MSCSWTFLFLLMWMPVFRVTSTNNVVPFDCRENPKIHAVPDILSFENASELCYFTFPNTSNLMRSSKYYKDGFHSLLWQWGAGDDLKLNLGRRLVGKHAGIKFWIYQNESVNAANLSVSLIDSTLPVATAVILQFNFSLSFTGWRAAWVALREANLTNPGKSVYDEIKFTAPSQKLLARVIFMDLFVFDRNVNKQSRDQIIPPITGDIYDITYTWQQTYRWSLVNPPKVNGTRPLTKKEIQQLKDLHLIKKRLLNWFANESITPMEFKGNVFKRWKYLLLDFQRARRYLSHLNITVSQDGVITGSPLFVRNSQFGNPLHEGVGRNKKLGDVTFQVLFPLTLEYYFSAKARTTHNTIWRELANVNSLSRRKFASKRISNYDSEFLLSEWRRFKTPLTPGNFRQCLQNIKKKKLRTIMLLLKYITDQGWTEGSAMGSLNHEMNRAGNGFMNSMFLLRDELAKAGKLEQVLKVMRWYNNMGEIYQRNFEHSGTTADRLRTMVFYRLEIVLMSSDETVYEKRAKLRDMAAYVRWCNNALLSHPAFLPMFKPDRSCFHHLGIYGPAYTPGALTTLSNIWHLLRGTSFSLNTLSKANIRGSLLSYTRLTPQYSLPNSISGRFPSYSDWTLIIMLQAYAFFSIQPQNLTNTGHLQEVVLGNDTEMTGVFLRLYDPKNFQVKKYLRATAINERQDLLFTIGALQIFQAVYRKAKKAQIQPAASQKGHWVHNFAALSIHRRKDWVITAKGFNRYVWDYERSPTQNVYGLYQSHGALQISNSEASLNAYDVEHGWDWTRVPGTTTIKLSLNEMQQGVLGRNYQQSKLVGGVLFTSNDPSTANGVFAMEFQRPLYGSTSFRKSAASSKVKVKNSKTVHEEDNEFREATPTQNIYVEQNVEFKFKKSVFFYNSLIVCLGSDIHVENSQPRRTQTTLFQDKYISTISSIYINGDIKWLSQNFSQLVHDSAAMLDTNGNGYYIPKGSLLNVSIGLQRSKTNDGKTATNARYATVWLDHGVNPAPESYEYAILVATDASSIEALRSDQTSDLPRYEVLHKNSAVHMVRFVNNPDTSSITYGYVFFNNFQVQLAEGPVKCVSAECIVMAEIDSPDFSQMSLSISSPDLNYNTTKVLNTSADNGINEYFYMRSQPVEITVYLAHPVMLQKLLINGKPVAKLQYDHYIVTNSDDTEHTTEAGNEIVFKNLVNGESVEVFLKASKNDTVTC